MRQLHIFSVKPKLDMWLNVDFCVLLRFYLNLPDLNLKLFGFDVQNKQSHVKFWFNRKNIKLSHTYLAVLSRLDVQIGFNQIRVILFHQYKRWHSFIDRNLKNIATLQVGQTIQCHAIVVQPLSQKPNKKGRRQPLRLRSIVFYAQSNRITSRCRKKWPSSW